MNQLMFPIPIPGSKHALMTGLLALYLLGCQGSTEADPYSTDTAPNEMSSAAHTGAAVGSKPYKPGPLAKYTLHNDFPINTSLKCRASVKAAYKDLENHLYGDWRSQQRDDLVIAYWPIYSMIRSQCDPR